MEESDLYCIAYGYPKGNRDLDFPLTETEHLSVKEKIAWIDGIHPTNCVF